MKQMSVFVFEETNYSKSDLERLFSLEGDALSLFLKKLINSRVLKLTTESTGDDILFDDREPIQYKFTYVGLVYVDNCLIKALPKYLRFWPQNSYDRTYAIRQLVKVIHRYRAKTQNIQQFGRQDDSYDSNFVSLALYLFNDYFLNGLYESYHEVVEQVSIGPALWDKTINETSPLVHQDQPYYLSPFYKRVVEDDHNIFEQIHRSLLTECSTKFASMGLDEILGVTNIELTDKSLEDIGTYQELVNRIRLEKGQQFDSRKLNLLDAFEAFILKKRFASLFDGVVLYGTTNFNLVWQDVCSVLLGNQLNQFKSYIPKPEWQFDGLSLTSSQTLEPDIVRVFKINDENCFLVADAKYYTPKSCDGLVVGAPGVQDLIKQHLYLNVYREFMERNSIKRAINCFIMPMTRQNDKLLEEIGNCGFPPLLEENFDRIKIYLLHPMLAYVHYLWNESVDLDSLLGPDCLPKSQN